MQKALSKYSKIFDNGNQNWSEDNETICRFLRYTEKHATLLLKTRGTILLNEVYDMLGFDRTQEGQVVGWHYDPKNPIGDNFVEFEISDGPLSGSFAIDFNVDGEIIQYL